MNGILLVDKPAGPTSHDIVGIARRALGIRRIGHAGTLDPFATGLLVLLIGKSSRLNRFISGQEKTYRGRIRLGFGTDTDDLTGERLAGGASGIPNLDVVRAAATKLTGEFEQIPPAFSAVKVDGRKAYAEARQGRNVELPARRVVVHSLELSPVTNEEFEFSCHVSSGTYIRSIARDLGAALGCGGHLTALRRTSIGDLDVASAVTPEEIAQDCLIDGDRALGHLKFRDVDTTELGHVVHGRAVEASGDEGEWIRLCHEGRLAAVAEIKDGSARPRVVIAGD